jgi:hypothetical protein
MWHPALAPIEVALDRLDRFPWWTDADGAVGRQL